MLFGIIVIIVLFVAFWMYAHRDPDRKITPFDGYLCPADGIVIGVHNVAGKKQFIKKKNHGITALLEDFPKGKVIVVIMMKFWHVHTQRAPTNAPVVSVTHKKGTFKNAVFGEYESATVENEHVAFTFGGKKPSKVYLVAGLVAKRIKTIVKPKEKVSQGDRIGMIHFGSQVAIVLPETKVLVKKGDRVTAGVTKLAK